MDLVFEFSNSLSSEMCKKIHDRFDGDFRVKTFTNEDSGPYPRKVNVFFPS